jgi:hypothetical protein
LGEPGCKSLFLAALAATSLNSGCVASTNSESEEL